MDEVVRRFVSDNYGRAAVLAIQDIARVCGVAVAYLDRSCFDDRAEDRRGTALTDGEWNKVRDFESEYDEFVDVTPGPTGNHVSNEFMDYWLDECGIPGPEGERWSAS